MKKNMTLKRFLLLFVLLGLCYSNIQAQYTWTYASSGNWSSSTNWSPAGVPVSTVVAQFSVTPSAGSTVTLTAASTASGINVLAARTGALNIVGTATTTLSLPGASITLGSATTTTPNVSVYNNGSSASVLSISGATISLGASKVIACAGGTTSLTTGSSITVGSAIQASALTFLGGGTWNGTSGTGPGYLRLGASSAATNQISGALTVGSTSTLTNNGILELNVNAISATLASIIVNPFSQLFLNPAAATTYNQTGLTLNGNGGMPIGYAGRGALRSSSTISLTWGAAGTTTSINLASASVVYAGTTFTLNCPISGSGQLIKEGPGLLVLSGTSLTMTGGIRVAEGAMLVSRSGSLVGLNSITLGQNAGATTTLTFPNNVQQTIGNLSSSFTDVTGTITQVMAIGSGSTITINQTSNTSFGRGSVTSLTSVITGTTSAIVKTGTGILTLTGGGNTFYGGITLNDGELRLAPSATISIGSSTTLCPVNFTGGRLGTTGIAASAVCSLGIANIVSGSSSISLDGTNAHTIRFTSLGTYTGTLTIFGWQGAFDGTSGTKGKVLIGSSASLSADQLAQIQFNDGGNLIPAVQLSTGEIVPKILISITPASYGPFSSYVSNNISVSYSTTATYFTGNFRVQMSDGTGTFSNYTSNIIGTGTTATSGTIAATIPSGTSMGSYKVRVINSVPYTAASDDNGSYISVSVPFPVINSLSSYSSVVPGSTITISGSDFNATPSNNIVNFNGVKTRAISGSSTTLTVVMPYGAAFGPVSVLDTVTRYQGASSMSLAPAFNNSYFEPGVINFNPKVDYTTGVCPNIAAIADLDGDGLNELISVNKVSRTLNIFQNNGTGISNLTSVSISLPLQGSPSNVKVADIDGDGRPDLVVAGGSGGSTIQIYRNTTNFTVATTPRTLSFATRSDIVISSISTHPGVLAFGDFDRDGKIDIAAACYATDPGKLIILRNTNNVGTTNSFTLYGFTTGVNPTYAALTSSICVADFNNDQLPDIAVTNQNYTANGSVTVFRNTGGTPGIVSFSSTLVLTAGAYPIDIQAADVDKDGLSDLLVTHSLGNSVSLFQNTYSGGGTLSFASKTDITTVSNAAGVAVGDLDGDGKIDVAVASFVAPGSVTVIRNTSTIGAPSFVNVGTLALTQHPAGLNIGDVDNDGYPEIVTGNAATDTGYTISVFRNYPQVIMGNIVAPDPVVCIGESVTLGYSLSIPSGMTGSWSSSDPSIVTINSTTGTLVGISAGTATITFKATVTSGSISRCVTQSVTVNPLPAVNTTGFNTICNGTSISLTGTPAGGVWSHTGTATSVSASGVVTGTTSTGIDTIRYTYTIPETGCANSDTQVLSIIPLPTAGTITGADSVCPGGSITLATNGDAGGKWYSNNTIQATVDSLAGVVTGISSGLPIINYRITSSCGIFNAYKLVNVRSLPDPGVISAPATICIGSSQTITSTSTATGVWSVSAPAVLTVNASGLATGNSIGNATITYTASNICGSSYSVAPITVNTVPASPAAISGAASICAGQFLSLSSTTSGGNWSASSAAIATVNSVGVVSGVSAGTVQISYTVSNSCGTSLPATANVTVVALPIASITSAIVPCKGYSSNVVFGGTTGATINYSVDGGTALTATLTSGTYSISTGILSDVHTYQLNSVNNGVCIVSVDTTTTIVPQDMVWVGGTAGYETSWGEAANWTCGTVPTVTDSVIIPVSVHIPVILSNGSTRSITLYSGAEVSVLGVLYVNNVLNNNGTISGEGNVILNGTTQQKLSGTGVVNNLVVSNTAGVAVQPASKVIIGHSLNIGSGSFTTNDSLVLNSDASGSAYIGTLPDGSSISGKVQVMQYVQGGYRRFRFWAHPFSQAISMGQIQKYIDITGIGGSANGFTTTSSNAASAFRFDPYTSNNTAGYDPGWKAYTRISSSAADSNLLHPGQGIRLFFRGAKDEGLGYGGYVPSPVTVNMTGPVNQGRVDIMLKKGSIMPANQDLNMVGNPYPSPVDIGTILFNAKQAGKISGGAFYVWVPTIGVGGQYMAVAIGTTAAIPYYLQTNAAFQVRAAHDSDSLVFNEYNKATSVDNYLFKASNEYVTLNVYDINERLYDVFRLKFTNDATDANDNDADAVKIGGTDFGFYSISSDNRNMTIDARPFTDGGSIPLGLSTAYTQEFVIRAESVAVPAGKALYLHDKLLNKETLLEQGVSYSFSVTKDNTTQGDDRFELNMRPANAIANATFVVDLSPNPATDKVKLSLSFATEEQTAIVVTDITGAVIETQKLGAIKTGTTNIALSGYAAGVYMFTVNHGNETRSFKLIKE